MNFFPSFVVDKRKFYKNSTHLFLIVPNTSGKLGKHVVINNSSITILLIGLCLGITLGVALIPLFEIDCQIANNGRNSNDNIIINMQRVKLQKDSPIEASNSNNNNMLRPRFYSTELGLRKKLVAGIILTDYSQLENLVAINKTLGPFVNQILFFVMGQETSQKVRNLLGSSVRVVTLTSAKRRSNNNTSFVKLDTVVVQSQVGLMAIKYLGTKFADDYDFFYLSLDRYYTNGIVLQETVNQVSVSQDVFWGADNKKDLNNETCSLETGILLSRSILRKLSSRLDRCFTSSILKQQGTDPMRNCYSFSSISECSGTLQTRTYLTTSINFDLATFSPAMTIGPVTSSSEMYWIHLMISENRIAKIDEKITNLSGIMEKLFYKENFGYHQTNPWPIGISIPHRPKSRFDVLKWKFFTRSNLYPKNDHVAEMSLVLTDKNDNGKIEQSEIFSLIDNSAIFLGRIRNQNSDSFAFQYGYRKFEETRGMEYMLDFLNNLDGTLLRVQALRPISKVEILPMPFVTEIRRVTIVVPIISLDLYNETDSFIRNYANSGDNKSNSVLVFAIVLADSNNLTVPESNKLQNFKRMISRHNSDLNNDNQVKDQASIKVGQIVVNLKQYKKISSSYIFAIFDMLSNHILSSSTLVLTTQLFVEIKEKFLNRVRMNTILNFQIFSPIPFVEYDPKIYGGRIMDGNDENKQSFEISKSTGYFDRDSFNFLSFYIGDYLTARKKLSSNNFILSRRQSAIKLTTTTDEDDGPIHHLSQIFLSQFDESSSSSYSPIHFLRAPEPTLNIRFDDNLYKNCTLQNGNRGCLKRKWGSKAELAKLILQSSPLDNRFL